MRSLLPLLLLCCVLAFGGALACGGGGGGATGITVAVDPPAATLSPGGTQFFKASVGGTSNTAVVWTVEEAGGGRIDATGYYTAPTAPGTWHVRAVSAADHDRSAVAAVTVPAPPAAPQITSPPQDQAVQDGETATFSVSATGSAPLAYQWRRDGADIEGAHGPTYTTPPVTMFDSGARFSVTVGNGLGLVTSPAATLSVSPLPVPPTITQDPQDRTVQEGQPAAFSVAATGSGTLRYQWRRDGTDIPGATDAAYTLATAAAADSGARFSVRVANDAGTALSAAATLTVTGAPTAPTITRAPQDQAVQEGQAATFSVTATGTGPLAYQWRRAGAELPGAQSATYTTPAATAADDGARFSVVVSNSAGSAASPEATLSVSALPTAPAIAQQPQDQTVSEGQTATFTVTASGTGPLGYQWRRDGTDIPGAVQATYTTPAAAAGDDGAGYQVQVSNAAGSVLSDAATLHVQAAAEPPGIVQQPQDQTAEAGQPATFSVAASGEGLRYQWRRDGQEIPGATDAAYTLPAAATGDDGARFRVLVSNGAGSVLSDSARLHVQN